MVQHDGPNRAFMALGSEIHHSGVQNLWQRANRSFLDVILALDSDFEVAVTSKSSPGQVMGRKRKVANVLALGSNRRLTCDLIHEILSPAICLPVAPRMRVFDGR